MAEGRVLGGLRGEPWGGLRGESRRYVAEGRVLGREKWLRGEPFGGETAEGGLRGEPFLGGERLRGELWGNMAEGGPSRGGG